MARCTRWRLTAEHDVRTLFTAPTAIRVIRKEDQDALHLSNYDTSKLRALFLAVREKIGPVAAFKDAVIVQRLPKTRSGKVLRATMKQLADGVEYKVPPTIDDPEILGELAISLSPAGYPKT